MTEPRIRPSISDHDVESYMSGSVNFQEITGRDEGGALILNAACWPLQAHWDDDDAQRFGDGEWCEPCAWALLDEMYGLKAAPTTVSGEGDVVGVEIRDREGRRYFGTYDYCRTFFEPGEPRTGPCDRCGAETLRDSPRYGPGM